MQRRGLESLELLSVRGSLTTWKPEGDATGEHSVASLCFMLLVKTAWSEDVLLCAADSISMAVSKKKKERPKSFVLLKWS